MNSLIEYNKRAESQITSIMALDDIVGDVISQSAKILKDILSDNGDDVRLKLRAIDTSIKLRKQLKDEQHFNIKMAMMSTREEEGIDFSDIEEDEAI